MENLWKICHEGRSFPKKHMDFHSFHPGWCLRTVGHLDMIWIWNYRDHIIELPDYHSGNTFLTCRNLFGVYVYIYTHYKYIHATGFIYLLHLYISLPFWSPVQHPLTHRQPVGFPLGWTPASSNRFDEELEIPQWFQIHHPQELDPRRWMVPDVDQVRSKRVASGDSYDLQ